MALDLEKIFKLQSAGKLSLDQKIAVLEKYGVKIERREFARSIMDTLRPHARRAKMVMSEAMANATADQIKDATRKVLDKHMRRIESRYRHQKTLSATKAKAAMKAGKKAALGMAKRALYFWITTGGKNVCPQCLQRSQWNAMTISEWAQHGLPGEGFTYCDTACMCRLGLAAHQPWDEEPPPEELPPSSPLPADDGGLGGPAAGPVGEPLQPDAMAKVREAETGTAGQGYETAQAFRDDGEVFFRKDGGKDYVQFSTQEVKLLKGRVFTHNHPSGASFSIADISMMWGADLKEIRAVGRPGKLIPVLKAEKAAGFSYEYSAQMKFPAGVSKSEMRAIMEEEILALEAEVQSDLWQRIQAGKLSKKEASALYSHELWTRLSKKVEWFRYRRMIRE